MSVAGGPEPEADVCVVWGSGGEFLNSQYKPHHMKVIDRQGATILEKKHCFVEPFGNGLAQVHDFSGGLSKVKIGYIDKTCKYVWKPQN